MKKEIISKYEIKLEFDPKTENPSRLFNSFAELIDSVSQLDTVISKSVNTSVALKIYLDDIEKGSLIAKLWNELAISEDGKIDDLNDPEKVKEFIEEARSESLGFLNEGKSSVEELEELSTSINEIAKSKEIDKTFDYAEPNLIDLANSLNAINNSTNKLSENEKFTFKSEDDQTKELSSGTPKIDIEAVETALTQEEIRNESELFYKIKKPDFLGDSQWEFKHGNRTVKVKILHEDWLDRFHKGEVVVVPGDSLRVKVLQTSKYNRNGYLISETIEIIEVLDIRHKQDDEA